MTKFQSLTLFLALMAAGFAVMRARDEASQQQAATVSPELTREPLTVSPLCHWARKPGLDDWASQAWGLPCVKAAH